MKSPATQMLMLTVYDHNDAVFDSLAAGAHGYLVKPVRAAELLAAVRDVHAGGAPMTSNIARRVLLCIGAVSRVVAPFVHRIMHTIHLDDD